MSEPSISLKGSPCLVDGLFRIVAKTPLQDLTLNLKGRVLETLQNSNCVIFKSGKTSDFGRMWLSKPSAGDKLSDCQKLSYFLFTKHLPKKLCILSLLIKYKKLQILAMQPKVLNRILFQFQRAAGASKRERNSWPTDINS